MNPPGYRLQRGYPDLPEIGIEALGVDGVGRAGLGLAEALELGDAPEGRHPVYPERAAVVCLRELDRVTVRLEARYLDLHRRDRPDPVGLLDGLRAIRRPDISLDRVGEPLEPRVALPPPAADHCLSEGRAIHPGPPYASAASTQPA